MRFFIILIVLICFSFSACENNQVISERDLIGFWKEIDSTTSKKNKFSGISISKMESGLYEEDIVIINNSDILNYSPSSCGCFIELKDAKKNLQTLVYTCLNGGFEHEINISSNKLKIGNRIFKKI
ncbi:hypothetical protein N9B82_04900 [Saprospiraceae bacterium]|nr:hypothetical protein [Saprospiraceae bacterium]